MTGGNGFSCRFSISIPRYARSLSPTRTAVDQLILRNENVIGGKCWLLAIGRQADRHPNADLILKMAFLQNIVQAIVFIEREKVHPINILQFKMEQLVE